VVRRTLAPAPLNALTDPHPGNSPGARQLPRVRLRAPLDRHDRFAAAGTEERERDRRRLVRYTGMMALIRGFLP